MRADVRFPDLLTVDEAALALRVSPATIYRWASAGTVPVAKVGGVLRFRADELARLVGEDGSAARDAAAPKAAAGRVRRPGRRNDQGAA